MGDLFNSPEFIYGIIFAGIFFLIGLLIQIGGTFLADWKNHKRRLQYLDKEHEKKLDYMRKELIFQSKLEYFKKIGRTLEEISMKISSQTINSKEKLIKIKLEVGDLSSEIGKIRENDIFFISGGWKPLLTKFMGIINRFLECKLNKKEIEKIDHDLGYVRAKMVIFIQKEINL